MAKMRRKTLIVCTECHDHIHANPVAHAAQVTGEPSASKGCPLGSEEGCEIKGPHERDLAAQPILLGHVLAEHPGKVALAEDQGPVEQLAAEGPDDTLADGIHPRRPRQGGDGPQPFGLEHFAECSGEQRIAIVDQEPQRAEAVPRSMARLRACCTTHAPAGHAVTPARCTRRVPCSVNISTCNRCSSTVSITRKSQAMIAWISHTVDAAIACPSRASSPWILRWPQAGFSRAIWMTSVLTEVPVDGRPGRRRLL
jgi:hypothetical protein